MKNFKLVYFKHNKNEVPPHGTTKTNFYDLTLLLRGKRKYKIGDQIYTLKKDDVIFIKPNSIRQQFPTDMADYVSFNFTCENEPDLPLFMEKGVSLPIKCFLSAYDELVEKIPNNNTSAIDHITQGILETLLIQNLQQQKNPIVASIESYIAKNLKNKIYLKNIGEELNYSHVYCDIVFKREMGKSIIAYLLEQRILEAKKLMIVGSLSLQQIANNVGFDDYNYFSRTFKKMTGYTPGQFYSLAKEKSQAMQLISDGQELF